ncbi:MAG TPA: tetratricopeptide repeat protein, partial [Tepidisphaeraceae bacterium]|nr:tetratricopeptide repeat protein [Tepidisphaeraceae bacterium]
ALLLTQRRFDESIALLEEAIDQHPRHAIAWANLLRVRRATDPNHISSKIIEDVKRLTQNDPWPLRLLARECLLKQEWRDAETLARASLALFPRHAETINDLAQSLAFQNRIDESIADIERATKMRPDLTIIRDNLEKARALKASGASVTPPAPQTQQR